MPTLLRPLLVMILAAALVSCDGMDDHGSRQSMAAGKSKLQSGIAAARAGIAQYGTGQPTAGLAAIDQGRGMMGQGMVDMGLGCCIGDGSPQSLAAAGADTCASSMGAGAPAMVQGLGKFDGGRSMMSHDAGGDAQGMADMESAMQMMEQGSMDMMSSGGGMGGMM